LLPWGRLSVWAQKATCFSWQNGFTCRADSWDILAYFDTALAFYLDEIKKINEYHDKYIA
jgi:hypothetical protein